MPPLTLESRYQIGQELTTYELREAFKRIQRREPPRGVRPEDLARGLASAGPLRFEFEINRLRGFAWDHDE